MQKYRKISLDVAKHVQLENYENKQNAGINATAGLQVDGRVPLRAHISAPSPESNTNHGNQFVLGRCPIPLGIILNPRFTHSSLDSCRRSDVTVTSQISKRS